MDKLKIGDKVKAYCLHGTIPYDVVGNITDMTDKYCVLNNDYVVWKKNCIKL